MGPSVLAVESRFSGAVSVFLIIYTSRSQAQAAALSCGFLCSGAKVDSTFRYMTAHGSGLWNTGNELSAYHDFMCVLSLLSHGHLGPLGQVLMPFVY